MRMEPQLFEKFSKMVGELSGIQLPKGKESLLISRIQKRMRELNIGTHEEYYRYVSESGDQHEVILFLDAISTNVTHFFREPEHFQDLKKFIMQESKLNVNDFKIWCAASSSGEEPYTLAITLAEIEKSLGIRSKILATDISTRVLKLAASGYYSVSSLKTVPDEVRKYFDQVDDGTVSVAPELKKRILYKRLNLNSFPFPLKGPLDVIFCRNVMIYFNAEHRQKILDEFARLLRPRGLLIISHTESLSGLSCPGFKLIKPSVYVRKGS